MGAIGPGAGDDLDSIVPMRRHHDLQTSRPTSAIQHARRRTARSLFLRGGQENSQRAKVLPNSAVAGQHPYYNYRRWRSSRWEQPLRTHRRLSARRCGDCNGLAAPVRSSGWRDTQSRRRYSHNNRVAHCLARPVRSTGPKDISIRPRENSSNQAAQRRIPLELVERSTSGGLEGKHRPCS